MSRKKTILKAGCGVITLLGMGFVLGAISLLILIIVSVTIAEDWKSDSSKNHAVKQLTNQLELTEEQVEKVRPIVYEFLDRRWDLRRDYLRDSDQMMVDEYLPQIDELLNDEQKEKLKKVQDKWREEHKGKMEEPEPPAEE